MRHHKKAHQSIGAWWIKIVREKNFFSRRDGHSGYGREAAQPTIVNSGRALGMKCRPADRKRKRGFHQGAGINPCKDAGYKTAFIPFFRNILAYGAGIDKRLSVWADCPPLYRGRRREIYLNSREPSSSDQLRTVFRPVRPLL